MYPRRYYKPRSDLQWSTGKWRTGVQSSYYRVLWKHRRMYTITLYVVVANANDKTFRVSPKIILGFQSRLDIIVQISNNNVTFNRIFAVSKPAVMIQFANFQCFLSLSRDDTREQCVGVTRGVYRGS